MIEHNDEPKYPIEAISMLKADHRKVQNLFAEYDSAGDFITKYQIAEQVFTELGLHAYLEEQVFYPAYEARAGKNGIRLVADSRLEHETVKELMAELQDVDIAAEEFEAKFQELMHHVQHHIAEEENEMFPEAEQILAEQLEDLMDEMVELKQGLRTSTKL
jgi:hemerythrin superfamily protein